jgi:hypothetical protein
VKVTAAEEKEEQSIIGSGISAVVGNPYTAASAAWKSYKPSPDVPDFWEELMKRFESINPLAHSILKEVTTVGYVDKDVSIVLPSSSAEQVEALNRTNVGQQLQTLLHDMGKPDCKITIRAGWNWSLLGKALGNYGIEVVGVSGLKPPKTIS